MVGTTRFELATSPTPKGALYQAEPRPDLLLKRWPCGLRGVHPVYISSEGQPASATRGAMLASMTRTCSAWPSGLTFSQTCRRACRRRR